jgi:hypothetical protein
MDFLIHRQVAFLTECEQILISTIHLEMIQVCDCQDHFHILVFIPHRLPSVEFFTPMERMTQLPTISCAFTLPA